MNADQHQAVLAMNADKRCDYFLTQIEQQQKVWTIVDDQGVMLLVSDDEDCIPVWPAEEFVQEWINGDWAHCQAHSISMDEWQQKWLPGLEEDEIEVAVFPLSHDGGLVMSPWELSHDKK